MEQSMNLDHICLAVKKIDKAGEMLSKYLGYRPKTKKVANSRQKAIVQFYHKPGSLDIKLIEPSSLDSPLINFLKKGEGLHHLGFKVNKVEDAISELKEMGARITATPEPGEAFEQGMIGFSYLGSGLNIEVIDTDNRHGLLEANRHNEQGANE